MTLADFNLRRAALFATRIFVLTQMAFPRVNKEISRRKAAENLQSVQGYDPSEFTFSNGVFCDVKEKLCRDDRYFGVNGKRSGKINQTTTKMLFMCRE